MEVGGKRLIRDVDVDGKKKKIKINDVKDAGDVIQEYERQYGCVVSNEDLWPKRIYTIYSTKIETTAIESIL